MMLPVVSGGPFDDGASSMGSLSAAEAGIGKGAEGLLAQMSSMPPV
jgi:hypothetical protein